MNDPHERPFATISLAPSSLIPYLLRPLFFHQSPIMRTLLPCAVLLLAITAAGAADLKPFSPDDLVRLDRVSDPQLSPDGRAVVFTVRKTDMDANRGRTDLWLLDLTRSGAQPRQLTQHESGDSSGRWSPDSKSIYFLSSRSGSSQVWRLSLNGGEAAQVTRLPVGVNGLRLSPRGDRLLLALDVFPDCGADLDCTAKRLEEQEKSPETGRVYDRMFVRHWDSWKNGTQGQLFSVRLDGRGRTEGAAVNLSGSLDADVPTKPWGGDDDFVFSSDGARVVFVARVKGQSEPWSTNFDLYEVPADGSTAPRNFTTNNKAWDAHPVFSPDGRYLAWTAMERPGFEADRFQLMLRDLKSGEVRALTADWDRSIGSFSFSADGQRILATIQHLGQHPLWAIDLRSGKRTEYVAKGNVGSFSAGNKQVVFAMASLSAPAALYAIPAGGGNAVQLTHFNDDALAQRAMGEFEQFTFAGWNNETVYAYAMKPANYQPGRKYPVAFIIHGGPQGSFSNGWSFRWNPQIYAGAGYGVVFVDFHGSTGYGQEFTDSISGDWGGKPLEDLQKGLAAALEKYNWLDGERVGALGASYGGYMINWIAGNWPDRFSCLVNHDGVFDQRMMYYATEELWFPEWEHGGPYFQRAQEYEKHNPVLHVDKWKTPMLVIHGEQDFRVPDTQGLGAFTALQRRGIDSRLLYFPDENHWVLKPHNSLQWHREVLGWLEKYLR